MHSSDKSFIAFALSISLAVGAVYAHHAAALPAHGATSLLRHATKVKKLDDIEYWQWLSPGKVLLAHGSKAKGYRLTTDDVRTGKEQPLQALTNAYVNFLHSHDCFSPDGRYKLWRVDEGKLRVMAVDGGYDHVWSNKNDEEHQGLTWCSDSRHFLLIGDWDYWQAQNDGKKAPYLNAYLYDVQTPAAKPRLLRLPIAANFGWITPTLHGTLIGYTTDGVHETLRTARHLLVGELRIVGDTFQYTKQTIAIPTGKKAEQVTFSPDGAHIAWSFATGVNGEENPSGYDVWTSTIGGGKWREVGKLPASAIGEEYGDPEVMWTPDGKFLSFAANSALWTTTAP